MAEESQKDDTGGIESALQSSYTNNRQYLITNIRLLFDSGADVSTGPDLAVLYILLAVTLVTKNFLVAFTFSRNNLLGFANSGGACVML